jgi:hypothetical protein
LADFDAELEQFTIDPTRPQRGLALLMCRIRFELLDVPMGVRISNAKAR